MDALQGITTVKELSQARRPSVVRIALVALALVACANYLLFVLNPQHIGNLGFYLISVSADILATFVLVSSWSTVLYFELFKSQYYQEIDTLRNEGSALARERVAALVPVVGEDIRIVRHTIESLMALQGDVVVYVLDDGRRAETRALCEELGVAYITRDNNQYFKAGNLNNGLRHVREDYVIVVDADFSLHPEFVQRTLPIFADPTVAAVQTPQIYGNDDTLFSRGCRYMQSVFYDYLQPGKNLMDSAFCVGTNVVYRRSALDAIGGIAEMAHSEDVFTTLRFLEHGYRVFFLNERLAMGLSPSTVVAFFNQQFRWARGGLTMLFHHNTLFNKRLKPVQRMQFFSSNAFYLSGIAVAIYLFGPLLAILFGFKPINDQYIMEWWPRYAFFLLANVTVMLVLSERNRWQSAALGLFCFIPYLGALTSVAMNRRFLWKPTNASSTALITKIVAPLILFVTTGAITIYLIAVGVVSPDASLALYYVAFALGLAIAIPLVVSAYAARAKFVIPETEPIASNVVPLAARMEQRRPVHLADAPQQQQEATLT